MSFHPPSFFLRQKNVGIPDCHHHRAPVRFQRCSAEAEGQLGSDGVLGWLRYVSTEAQEGFWQMFFFPFFYLWWAYMSYMARFFWSYYENHVTLVLDVLFFNGLPSAKRCHEKENCIWSDRMISFLLDVVSNSSLRKRFHFTSFFLDSIAQKEQTWLLFHGFHAFISLLLLMFRIQIVCNIENIT